METFNTIDQSNPNNPTLETQIDILKVKLDKLQADYAYKNNMLITRQSKIETARNELKQLIVNGLVDYDDVRVLADTLGVTMTKTVKIVCKVEVEAEFEVPFDTDNDDLGRGVVTSDFLNIGFELDGKSHYSDADVSVSFIDVSDVE